MRPTSLPVRRRRTHTVAHILTMLSVAALLAACGSVTSNEGTGELDPTATVRFAITVAPTQLDPIKITNEVGDTSYFVPLYDRLTTVSGNDVVPQLAEKWTTSADGLTWTFNLRGGSTFHDGTPIDAAAVVANLERAYDAGDVNPLLKSKLRNVTGFEAPDSSTVVITLSEPRPGLAAAMSGATLGISSPAAFDQASTEPVGSGPFTFVRQDADRVAYARFEDYWDKDRAKAAKLEVVSIPDGTARLNAVRSGQADAALAQLDLISQIEKLKSDPSFTVEKAETQSVLTLYLNSQKPPLDDVRVRRALNYAVDRESISKDLLGGACTPTTQPFPSGAGHVDGLDDAYAYDPDKAAGLLEEAGVSDLELDGIYLNAALSKAVAPAIQDQLKQAGVTLDLKAINPVDARPLFREGHGAAMVHQINGELDQALMLESTFLGPDNPGGGMEPSLEAATTKAVLTPYATDERAAALQEFSKQAVDSPEGIYICGIPDHFVAKKNVAGLTDMPWFGIQATPDPSGLGLTS